MVLKIAKRGTIPPFIVMDVLRAANEREAKGEGVLHLEVLEQHCLEVLGVSMQVLIDLGIL